MRTTYWLNMFCIFQYGTPHRTRHVDPMLAYCWQSVYDAGPTLRQHWINVPCLLGQNEQRQTGRRCHTMCEGREPGAVAKAA